MSYKILVASYTDSIHTVQFDPTASPPALQLVKSTKVGHHPSWITRHPDASSLAFTGLEQSDGRLLALKIGDDASVEVLADVSSAGRDPCGLLVFKDQVFVGNYSSGTVGIFTLPGALTPSSPLSSSTVTVSESQPALQFTGSGPQTDRQEASHPHQVYLTTSSDGAVEILIPDLGSDKTWRVAKGEDGSWVCKGTIEYIGDLRGGGPRHVGIKEGILYTLMELSNTIVAHDISSTDPVVLATSPTLFPPPAPKPDPTMLSAELLIPTPSTAFPQSLIFTSNRNDPREGGDTIEVFETLTPTTSTSTSFNHVTSIPTKLNHLRGMVFFGPDEKYLIAGGANGGGIKVFERTESSVLKEVAWLETDALNPTGFLVL